jgi:hypothetical protein
MGHTEKKKKPRTLPSRDGTGQTTISSMQCQLPSSGGVKKLYSEALSTGVDKRYKLMVKSKHNLSTEAIKSVLKTKLIPQT